ncbi:MAG TPA: TlpA disulfide reductase family protein [Hyphomicrobiales bacterium]|nr:TlpA disulfide reductase family protein [Hyphomicrobiales bacterium]
MSSVVFVDATQRRRLKRTLLCFAFSIFLAASTSALGQPRIGAPAPALIVTTPGGQSVDLSTLKGRVVLVNFWATWCGPCLEELPIIEKFYRKHHKSGFEVVALSIDIGGAQQRAKTIIGSFPFHGALLSAASKNGFGKPEFVPLSYLIDARGVVREAFEGGIEARDMNETVLPLLKETAVQPHMPEETSVEPKIPEPKGSATNVSASPVAAAHDPRALIQ